MLGLTPHTDNTSVHLSRNQEVESNVFFFFFYHLGWRWRCTASLDCWNLVMPPQRGLEACDIYKRRKNNCRNGSQGREPTFLHLFILEWKTANFWTEVHDSQEGLLWPFEGVETHRPLIVKREFGFSFAGRVGFDFLAITLIQKTHWKNSLLNEK